MPSPITDMVEEMAKAGPIVREQRTLMRRMVRDSILYYEKADGISEETRKACLDDLYNALEKLLCMEASSGKGA